MILSRITTRPLFASTSCFGIASSRIALLALLTFLSLFKAYAQSAIGSPSINNVTTAAYYAGADCGAKIMAADAAWLGTPIEIDVTQGCGLTIASAVTPTAGHVLKFTQPGIYTLTGQGIFTLSAAHGALSCVPGVTILKSSNNTMIQVNGDFTTISGCTIDGGGLTATFNMTGSSQAGGSGIVAAVPSSGAGGSGYNIGDRINISGATGSGGQLRVSSVDGTGTVSGTGGINAVTVGSTGGTGYQVGDILTITQGTNSTAQAQVTLVTPDGAVRAAVITGASTAGSGYTLPGTSLPTAGGHGSGATLTLTNLRGQITGLTVYANGTGYTLQSSLATTPATGTGAGASVNITSVGGGISTVAIASSGTSYNVGDVLMLTGGGGSGGEVQVTSVSVSSGQVTGVMLYAPGSSYAITTSPSATTYVGSGYGSGLTINITQIGAQVLSYSNLNTGIETVAVATGGSGYVVGDLLNVQGGGNSIGGSVRVTSVSGGAVTGVALQTSGTGYSYPTVTSPATTTAATGAGSGATVTVTGLQNGISSIGIASGGSGYAVGDMLTISGGTNGIAAVTSVSSSGQVSGVSITASGTGYSLASAQTTTTSGGGSGALINILATGYAVVPAPGQRLDIHSQPANTIADGAYIIIGATNSGASGTISIASTSGYSGTGNATPYVWTAWNGYAINSDYTNGFMLKGTTIQGQDRATFADLGSSNYSVVDNKFINNGSGGSHNGGGSNVLIQGNSFSPALTGVSTGIAGGLYVFSSVGAYPTNLVIANNSFIVGNGFGITVQSSPGNEIIGYVVKGNTITNILSPAAGTIEGAISCVSGENAVIEGNTYTNLTGQATQNVGFELGLSNSVISNNTLIGAGIGVYTGHNKIIGNHIKTLQANIALGLEPNVTATDMSDNLIENNEFSSGASPWGWQPGQGINGNYTFLDGTTNCSGPCFQMYVMSGTTQFSSTAPTWGFPAGTLTSDGTTFTQNVGPAPPANFVGVKIYCLTVGSHCNSNTISNNTFIDNGAAGHTAIVLSSSTGDLIDDTLIMSNHFVGFATCYAGLTGTSGGYNTNVWWNEETRPATGSSEAGCATVGPLPVAGVAPYYGQYIGLQGTLPSSILPTATSSTLGVVRPDNTTITISGGVLSSATGGGNVTASTLSSGSVPVATGVTSIANSSITDNGTNTGIGHPLSSYNGLSLTGAGVPLIIGAADLIGQTNNVSNYTIYSVPATPLYSYYRVCEYGIITTAAATSSTLPTLSAKITDPVNSVAVAIPMGLSSTLNATNTAQGGCVDVHPKPGTPIYINSSGYASNPANTMAFEVHATVEAIR